MKVLIFQTAEPLHIDEKITRKMRAMNLADKLIEEGHDVHILSTDFYHQIKKNRFGKNKTFVLNDKLKISLLKSTGYKQNRGLMRILDHSILSINLVKKLIFLRYKNQIQFSLVILRSCHQ